MRMVLAAASALVAASGAAAGVRVVAREGDPAPGVAGTFESVGGPAIDASGRVLFWGVLPVQGVNRTGYWLDPSDQEPELAQFSGFSAAGFTWDLGVAVANDAGEAAFAASVRPPQGPAGGRTQAVFRPSVKGPVLLDTPTQGAAPLTDGRFGELYDLRLRSDGTVSFIGSWFVGHTFRSVYASKGDDLVPIAHTGMTIPGVQTNTFRPLRAERIGPGTWLIGAEFAPTPTSGFRPGVFRVVEGQTPVFEFGPGTAAPGIPGATLTRAVLLSTHPSGTALVRGTLALGGPVTTSNDGVVWALVDGVWTLVAREGGPLPGVNASISWSLSEQLRAAINADGVVVLELPLLQQWPVITDANDWTLCVWRDGQLEILAREADPAPGGGLYRPEQGRVNASVDSSGRVVAFIPVFGAPGFPANSISTLLAFDPQAGGRFLGRSVFAVELDAQGGAEVGQLRLWYVPDTFRASGASNGSPLNDAGQFAVEAELAGDFPESFVFVHDVGAPSPCPGDLDGDGLVNSEDLASLLAQWNRAPVLGGIDADLNGNTTVSAADLAILLSAWGACTKSDDFASVAGGGE